MGKNRQRRSQAAVPNVQTTEPNAQPPAEPNALIQEKIMEASQENTAPTPAPEATSPSAAPSPEAKPEQETTLTVQEGPTAKELAAAEELNAKRVQDQIKVQQAQAERDAYEPLSLISLAAQGREALLEGMRQHQERAAPIEYVPPPRTERQMSALQAELEAGRQAQQRAEAQQANRPPPEPPKGNEGFTTPVYRPDNMVPDPMMGNGAHGGGVYQPIKTD